MLCYIGLEKMQIANQNLQTANQNQFWFFLTRVV